jgi:uncharacterized integral membrane protein
MHKLIRILAAIFLLLVFFATVGFSFLNTTPVALSMGFWEFAPQPLAVWVVAAFALGGLLGLLFATGFSKYLKNKLELRRLRKQLSIVEAENNKLRSLSVKEGQ